MQREEAAARPHPGSPAARTMLACLTRGNLLDVLQEGFNEVTALLLPPPAPGHPAPPSRLFSRRESWGARRGILLEEPGWYSQGDRCGADARTRGHQKGGGPPLNWRITFPRWEEQSGPRIQKASFLLAGKVVPTPLGDSPGTSLGGSPEQKQQSSISGAERMSHGRGVVAWHW